MASTSRWPLRQPVARRPRTYFILTGYVDIARPQQFKNAIFDSAVKLFGEKGLSETGIRAIAKEAGVIPTMMVLRIIWRAPSQITDFI